MFGIQRSKLALALLIGGLSRAVGIENEVRIQDTVPTIKRERRGRKKASAKRSYNKFPPGTYGERECARRLGGEDLRLYRAADRRSRGLPA